MPPTCRLFPELRVPFEISRYARNDSVMYETENAAVSLFRAKREISCIAAATLVSGQRVIPNAVRNLEPLTSYLTPHTSYLSPPTAYPNY